MNLFVFPFKTCELAFCPFKAYELAFRLTKLCKAYGLVFFARFMMIFVCFGISSLTMSGRPIHLFGGRHLGPTLGDGWLVKHGSKPRCPGKQPLKQTTIGG